VQSYAAGNLSELRPAFGQLIDTAHTSTGR
jgi:hypothetical protein